MSLGVANFRGIARDDAGVVRCGRCGDECEFEKAQPRTLDTPAYPAAWSCPSCASWRADDEVSGHGLDED